jgi:hypothetical protein
MQDDEFVKQLKNLLVSCQAQKPSFKDFACFEAALFGVLRGFVDACRFILDLHLQDTLLLCFNKQYKIEYKIESPIEYKIESQIEGEEKKHMQNKTDTATGFALSVLDKEEDHILILKFGTDETTLHLLTKDPHHGVVELCVEKAPKNCILQLVPVAHCFVPPKPFTSADYQSTSSIATMISQTLSKMNSTLLAKTSAYVIAGGKMRDLWEAYELPENRAQFGMYSKALTRVGLDIIHHPLLQRYKFQFHDSETLFLKTDKEQLLEMQATFTHCHSLTKRFIPNIKKAICCGALTRGRSEGQIWTIHADATTMENVDKTIHAFGLNDFKLVYDAEDEKKEPSFHVTAVKHLQRCYKSHFKPTMEKGDLQIIGFKGAFAKLFDDFPQIVDLFFSYSKPQQCAKDLTLLY